MPEGYTLDIKIGTQSISTMPVQLTADPFEGEIVTALVASDDAFEYSDEADGHFRSAGLNSFTDQYEKLIPVANALRKMWFKSSAGTIDIDFEALVNGKAF